MQAPAGTEAPAAPRRGAGEEHAYKGARAGLPLQQRSSSSPEAPSCPATGSSVPRQRQGTTRRTTLPGAAGTIGDRHPRPGCEGWCWAGGHGRHRQEQSFLQPSPPGGDLWHHQAHREERMESLTRAEAGVPGVRELGGPRAAAPCRDSHRASDSTRWATAQHRPVYYCLCQQGCSLEAFWNIHNVQTNVFIVN